MYFIYAQSFTLLLAFNAEQTDAQIDGIRALRLGVWNYWLMMMDGWLVDYYYFSSCFFWRWIWGLQWPLWWNKPQNGVGGQVIGKCLKKDGKWHFKLFIKLCNEIQTENAETQIGMIWKYPETTSKWGRVKLPPSAATPPCQLTSRPGQGRFKTKDNWSSLKDHHWKLKTLQ